MPEAENDLTPELTDPQKLLEAQSRMFGRQEFHEFLTPQEVRAEACVTIDSAIHSFSEDHIAPNQYFFENSLYPLVRKRIERIDIAIPEGRVIPTDDEKREGLVAGKHQMHLPTDRVVEMLRNGWDIDLATRKWKHNGVPVADYDDDLSLVARFRPGATDVVPRNFYLVQEVSESDAEEKRDQLVEETKEQFTQIRSTVDLLNAAFFQDILSEDVGNYMDRRFTQVNGQWMISRYVGELLNAPESRPELMSRGDKLTEAFTAWRDIVEGRAVVQFRRDDGSLTNPAVLPNPFADKKNMGLRQMCFDYVAGRIDQKDRQRNREPGHELDSQPEYLKKINEAENETMARLAEVLANHWDLDTDGMDVWRVGGGDPDIHMEGAYTDSAIKAYLTTVRQASERYGSNWLQVLKDPSVKPERDHPRKTAVFTLRALPRMSSNFLEVSMVEAVVENTETGQKEKQRVTLDQAAYGTRRSDGKRDIRVEGEKLYSFIEGGKYKYEVVGLQNIDWDEIKVLVTHDESGKKIVDEAIDREDADLKVVANVDPADGQPKTKKQLIAEGLRRLEYAMGTNTNADKIPKTLFEFYLYNGVYKEFTRTDFATQYKEYTAEGKLRDLNKPISSAMNLPKTLFGLKSSTGKKLEEYLRITLCAGSVCNVVSQEGKRARESDNPDGQKQVDSKSTVDLNGHIVAMENAMLSSQFVRRKRVAPKMGVSSKESNYEWESEEDKKLFHWLIENRNLGPQDPFTLKKNGMAYFSDAELQELKQAYSFLFE